MNYLEQISENIHDAYFVDLFVRPSNTIAQSMYANLGYRVYQTVLKYYSGSNSGEAAEDADDLRKSLKRDLTGETSKPKESRFVKPSELEFH